MPTGTMKTSIQADNGRRLEDTNTGTLLENEVAARFGLVPNFFRLASSDPTITRNLWGFARFAYLDSPMPSLFKERLFVYLSRFCDVRYCIARHIGFLVGLGRPAGDADCIPQTVETVLPLLKIPLPHGEAFEAVLASREYIDRPLASFPEPESVTEQILFACATHLFLQTPDSSRALNALRSLLCPSDLEHLKVFLSFVRTAHYWTKVHPELAFEDDIAQLLEAHEALVACVHSDPEAFADGLSSQVAQELASLQELRSRNAAITQAYDTLSIDYQNVEQRLQDREANLRELVSSIPAAVYACDSKGRVIYYNRRAAELSGCERAVSKDAQRLSNTHNIHDGDAVRMLLADAPIKAVLASGDAVVNREQVLDRPDGTRIDVLVNIAPLRDSDGQVTGAVNILQDISELKRAQQERERLVQELERSNQALSQFSYAVSHDLQGPVRSVRALTQVLVRRNDGPSEDAAHLAALIEQAAEGMERLIDSLLRCAQAGQGELERQRVSAAAAVDAVRVSLGALIAKTGTRISATGLPAVDADPVQLQELFQNLISNAIKYHRQGEVPVIEIRGEAVPDGWRFAVKDNGEGILPEHQVLIFEALKRLHGSDTPGCGLGLALCKTIVARHGGRIWVESEGAGRGATFFFTLAAASQESPALDLPDLQPLISRTMETLTVQQQEVRDSEGRYYDMTVRPNRTSDNRIDGVLIAMADTDAIRRSLEETRRARDYVSAIVETVREPLVVLDSGLRVVTANSSFYAVFQLRREEVEKQRIFDLAGGGWEVAALRKLLEEILPADTSFSDFNVSHVFPRVGRRALLLNARRLQQTEHGASEMILLAMEDITDRESASEALRESRERLRDLTAGLLTAQEQEARRISRELHDDFNQRLAMVAVALETMEKDPLQSAELMRSQIASLRTRTESISDDMRRTAHRLHPSMVEHLGLTATLRSLCTDFSKQEKIRIDYRQRNTDGAIPPDISLCLYRVAQESLRNVVKHSGARRATVSLVLANNRIVLTIHDTGAGFDCALAKAGKGLGLVSLEERVRLVAGAITIRSRPGNGTRVIVEVPLPEPNP